MSFDMLTYQLILRNLANQIWGNLRLLIKFLIQNRYCLVSLQTQACTLKTKTNKTR